MDYFKNKLYRCFNIELKTHLLKSGCVFLMVCLDPNSKDKFWLFEKTNEFQKALMEFKSKGKV